jgi:hypothetical protein
MKTSITEISDVAGLREAIAGHEAALLSGDNSRISATVAFPHVQFMPDGRVEVYSTPTDLPDRGATQPEWRVSNSSLVRYEKDLAIVRASFEGTGKREGADLGAGLWCFSRRDGKWLVN